MIFTREQREAWEADHLAPYSLKSGASKGRIHPEPPDQYRTHFKRDRDRIVHTTAFRRLEYKTQVFVNYEGDYYRTRLTHSLEVAQIGRSLAQALGANEDLVETICLAHDLGHSPFGHAGEDVLNALMKDHGGFNHNHQTYRILTELEERYPNWRGLNLSYETLEGIAKHETRYDISGTTGYDPTLRGSLEAQLANLSDEMAYNAHDLDDGLRSDLINEAQLRDLQIWRMVKDSLGLGVAPYSEMMRIEGVRQLINLTIRDVLTTADQRLTSAKADTPLKVQQLDHNIAGYSIEFGKAFDELKDFLFNELYTHYRVMRMSFKAGRFIEQLFEAYTERPKQLPPSVQEKITERGLHRAVADYIAGMTDRFALQEWERLFDPFTRP